MSLSLVYTVLFSSVYLSYFLKIVLYFTFRCFLWGVSYTYVVYPFSFLVTMSNILFKYFFPYFVCFSHFWSLYLSVFFVFAPVHDLLILSSYLCSFFSDSPTSLTLGSVSSRFTSFCLVITFCVFTHRFFEFFGLCLLSVLWLLFQNFLSWQHLSPVVLIHGVQL